MAPPRLPKNSSFLFSCIFNPYFPLAGEIIFNGQEYHLNNCSLIPFAAPMGMVVAQHLVSLNPWLTLGYRPETLAQYLERPDLSLHKFLIVASDQNIGVMCYRYPWLHGPFLELLAVYPQFQGLGIGREVLAWLEHHENCANLWTTVSAFNTSALNFYLKSGFSEIGSLKNLVRDGFDEIFLRKILK